MRRIRGRRKTGGTAGAGSKRIELGRFALREPATADYGAGKHCESNYPFHYRESGTYRAPRYPLPQPNRSRSDEHIHRWEGSEIDSVGFELQVRNGKLIVR